LALLEDVREKKPTGSDDLEAWFVATRLLGDLYLNELQRPDLAVKCFQDYKEHPRSGADTLFYIAKSYEQLKDTKNALRFYEAVTAYDSHPKYWEANEAITRLKNPSSDQLL
jgi:predicted Zn-dependent protease